MREENQKIKAVVLYSGGLDSSLVLRILQEQGIQIEALNFRTHFGCCTEVTRKVADELGVSVTYLTLGDDYLRTIENPRYIYGRGVNPCVDCRIYMFALAKNFMHQIGAHFIASGEVVGQRPNSQRKDSMKAIQNGSDLNGLLLRPLSAKILPPTLAEEKGWVNREKLYDFSGRGRRGLIELGKKLGLRHFPTPSTGCLLTDKNYASRVRDMWRTENGTLPSSHYELLKFGRHFRIADDVKVIVGKNQTHNDFLMEKAQKGMTLFSADNFVGPSILAMNPLTACARKDIFGLMIHFSQRVPENPTVLEHNMEESPKTIAISSQAIGMDQIKEMAI